MQQLTSGGWKKLRARGYGPLGIYFTGEDEGGEINKELNGILLRAMAEASVLVAFSQRSPILCETQF
jgi:hypothetical protein